jgi:UrcA family protein
MSRFTRSFTVAALCSLATTQLAAADVVVEGESVARRLVVVAPADLANKGRQEAVQKQLKMAARDVCRAQYPVETTYLHARACYRGTLRDALDQLRGVEARWAKTGTPAQVAILILAR